MWSADHSGGITLKDCKNADYTADLLNQTLHFRGCRRGYLGVDRDGLGADGSGGTLVRAQHGAQLALGWWKAVLMAPSGRGGGEGTWQPPGLVETSAGDFSNLVIFNVISASPGDWTPGALCS